MTSLIHSGLLWNPELRKWENGSFDALTIADQDGVYETMLVEDGIVRDIEGHEKRFVTGCSAINLTATPLALPNFPLSGRWTLRWFRWRDESGEHELSMLFEGSLQPTFGSTVRVGLAPLSTVKSPPSPDVKHLSLFRRQVLKEQFKTLHGWDDYLVFHDDDKCVLEGSNWSFMALIDGEWRTSPIRQGLLRGTRITELLRIGSYNDFPVVEKNVTIHELKTATRLAGPSSSGIRTLLLTDNAFSYVKDSS